MNKILVLIAICLAIFISIAGVCASDVDHSNTISQDNADILSVCNMGEVDTLSVSADENEDNNTLSVSNQNLECISADDIKLNTDIGSDDGLLKSTNDETLGATVPDIVVTVTNVLLGEKTTVKVTMSGSQGTPRGHVNLLFNGADEAAADIVDGVATFESTFSVEGARYVEATYLPKSVHLIVL